MPPTLKKYKLLVFVEKMGLCLYMSPDSHMKSVFYQHEIKVELKHIKTIKIFCVAQFY